MCLYLKHLTPRYATKDIVVYKWLLPCIDGTALSPFKNFKYEYNKVYTSPLLRSVNYRFFTWGNRKYTLISVPRYKTRQNKTYIESLVPASAYVEDTVEIGFHTLDSIEAAKDYKGCHLGMPRSTSLCKCIIPKHSWYYIGDDGELASDQIIIKEQPDPQYQISIQDPKIALDGIMNYR